MKRIIKGLFSIALLTCMAADAADQFGTSFLLGGNVGNIAGGGLIEEAGRTHRFDSDKMYGCFNTHSEYNKSTSSSKLGRFFSPITANNQFRVGKANATAATMTGGVNTATDVYSVFFLLDEDYEADIVFKPVSSTFTSNLSLFVGLDEFMEGLWFDVNLPIVHNKREVKITETQVTAATNATYGNGMFEDGSANETVPYTTFKAAMVGDKVPNLGVASTYFKYGKVNGSRSHTKVGNVTIALGYDFMNKENMHLGVALSALVNGNGKSDAVYMFEPSVGTGGRHGIGARLDGHVRVYEKDDAEISMYLKANVHHLFDSTVLRTYDFKTQHGVWSRYILFKEWVGTLAANLAPQASGSVHGGNLTTLNAKVGIGAMYDVNLMGSYTNGSLGINVGYGLSGHSSEKWKSWVDAFTTKNYGAYMGDIADFDATNGTEDLLSTDVKIDGSNGTDATDPATAIVATTNIMVLADIDTKTGMTPSSMVHRVYGDVNYHWADSEWEPHVGVGGGAEFSSNNKAIAQWGVHFHGGVCF